MADVVIAIFILVYIATSMVAVYYAKKVARLQEWIEEADSREHLLETANCRMCGALVALRFNLEHHLSKQGYRDTPIIPPEELQSMVDYCIIHTIQEDCREWCEQTCRICGRHVCECVRHGLVVGDVTLCSECEDGQLGDELDCEEWSR